jgi:hypothetical protein
MKKDNGINSINLNILGRCLRHVNAIDDIL